MGSRHAYTGGNTYAIPLPLPIQKCMTRSSKVQHAGMRRVVVVVVVCVCWGGGGIKLPSTNTHAPGDGDPVSTEFWVGKKLPFTSVPFANWMRTSERLT